MPLPSDHKYHGKLFEQLVSLLGESTESVPFKRFMYDLKDQKIKREGFGVGFNETATCTIKSLGIQIQTRLDKVDYIRLYALSAFHLEDKTKYVDDITCNIQAEDDRETVRKKINRDPIHIDERYEFCRDVYDMKDFYLSFSFWPSQLSLITLSLPPEKCNENPIVYEDLIAILGMPRNENADQLLKIIDILGEKPVFEMAHAGNIWYQFFQSGVRLTFDEKRGVFIELQLTFVIQHDNYGDFGTRRPYTGDLPYGLTGGDTIEAMEKKVPGITYYIKDDRFDTDFGPLEIKCTFNRDHTFQESYLRWLEVKYKG